MSEHVPSYVMLGALLIVLGSIVALALSGQKLDNPGMVTLISSAAGIAGAIGGYSMPRPPKPPTA